MQQLTALLMDASEPEWILLNEKLHKVIEFALWDTARDGLALHLNGTTPCSFIDTDKLLALLAKAIGKIDKVISSLLLILVA